MINSPAEVLRQVVVAEGLGTMPSANGSWPISVGSMSDKPDNYGAFYDTGGRQSGRLHRRTPGNSTPGKTVEYPGVQFRIRATSHPTAWPRIQAIFDLMDDVKNLTVEIGANVYLLQSVTKTSTILFIGTDEFRRVSFTFNVVLTVKEV